MMVTFAQRMGGLTADAPWFKVSYSSIAWVVLLTLAIFSRFAHLAMIPLQPRELPTVVSALNLTLVDHSAVTEVSSTGVSPLLHSLYQVLFSLFGPNIGLIRFPNALLGVCLICCPVLFRKYLRAECSGIISILLLISPLVLLSSRYAESALWATIGCVLTFHALHQCLLAGTHPRKRITWQIWFTVLSFITVFLTDGRSFILWLSIAFALFFTLNHEASAKHRLKELIQDWPWRKSIVAGLATVILLSTQLLTHWSGLNYVGHHWYASLSGWIQTGDLFLDLRVSLFHELGFWLLAIMAIITLWRKSHLTPLHRFSISWLAALLILLALDRGTNPAHVSWLSIPLIIIVADYLTTLLQDSHLSLSIRGPSRNVLISSLLFALSLVLLVWIGLQFRTLIARTDFLPFATELLHGSVSVPSRAVMWWLTRISLGFLLYIFVLLALQYLSSDSSKRSFFLPTLAIFLLLLTTNSSVRAASADQYGIRSAWLPQLNTQENVHLHKTLHDLVQQTNWNRPSSIAWVTAAGIRDDQLLTILWLLRDFNEIRVLPKLELAAGFPLLISDPIAPEEAGERLAALYIGHPFSITRVKQAQPLGVHFLSQFLVHPGRESNQSQEAEHIPLVLWLRRDVLNHAVNQP